MEKKEAPLFSIVIIILDYPHLLSVTLDSITKQAYPDYEIIVLESLASVFVQEIHESHKEKIAKIYRENDANFASLMNKGISYSKGRYVHFMHPGDTYLSRHALEHVANLAKTDPDIIYCGYLLRSGSKLPEAVVHPLDLQLLKQGKLPTRLQCFWFSKELFQKVGEFNTWYHFRPGFEMICRVFGKKEVRTLFTHRVLVDSEFRPIPPSEMLKFAFETFYLILKNFGVARACAWWFIQDQIGLFTWLFRQTKQAFWQSR